MLWSPSVGLARQYFEEREEKKKRTPGLRRLCLDQRRGELSTLQSFAFQMKWDLFQVLLKMQEKYQWLGVLGIKLASVQRQEVVSHHLFCIFIICQCEEVFVTKKKERKKERKKFLGKYLLIQMRWFPSPQPPGGMCVLSAAVLLRWLCASTASHFLAEIGMGWALG